MSNVIPLIPLVVWCPQQGRTVARSRSRRALEKVARACCAGPHQVMRLDGMHVETVIGGEP